jgi:hypothetical protein
MLCSGLEAEGWNCGADVLGSWSWGGSDLGIEKRSRGARRCEEVLNVEELDIVGLGDTGPSLCRRALRAGSGSEESRSIT